MNSGLFTVVIPVPSVKAVLLNVFDARSHVTSILCKQRFTVDKTVVDRLLLVEMRPKTVGNTSGHQQFKCKTVQANKLKGMQTGSGTVHDRVTRNDNNAQFTKYRKVYEC